MLPCAMAMMIVYALTQSIAPNLFNEKMDEPELQIEEYAEMYDVNITCICKPFDKFKPEQMLKD